MRNQVSQSKTIGSGRYNINSLSNGLAVLEHFDVRKRGFTIMEIARSLGWTKTTAFRYVTTLAGLGYLDFDEPTRRYQPAVKVLKLGFSYLSSLTFVDIAMPFLERLSQRFGESTNLAVLDGVEIVYVARVGSKRIISVNLGVGSRLPAYCTSMGKVLLAFLGDREREEAIEKIVFARHTPKTVASAKELRRSLEQVREDGYAINDQEMDPGLRSCAAPVFDRAGTILAAANLSVSSAWVSVKDLEKKYVPMIVETSREITNILKSRC